MNKCFLQYRVQGSVLILFLLSLLGCGAAQFVDLTVEIEINNWDHWFFMDKKRSPALPESGIAFFRDLQPCIAWLAPTSG